MNTMTCLKARRILLESGETHDTLDEHHVMAERHVEECAECKQVFQQEEDLRLLVRSSVLPLLLPDSRLFHCWSKERRRRYESRAKRFVPPAPLGETAKLYTPPP